MARVLVFFFFLLVFFCCGGCLFVCLVSFFLWFLDKIDNLYIERQNTQ